MSQVWKHSFVSHLDRPGIEVYFYHLLMMGPLKCYSPSLSLQYQEDTGTCPQMSVKIMGFNVFKECMLTAK